VRISRRCAILRHMKQPSVYILASKRDGVLYIGVTSDLWQRMAQHTQHLIEGFTAKYNVTQLVHFECFDSMDDAIAREKHLKRWLRAWKVKLIERTNPEWRNLYDPETGEIEEAAVASAEPAADTLHARAPRGYSHPRA
ncbi:MAG: GIY-YIG nuclease family protein, partial [Methyloligellaceae bacterium]